MPQSRAFFEILRVRMHCRCDTEGCPYTAVKSKDMIQCLFYIWKVVLSISKGFHLLLDIKLKSLKLFENASIPFEDNLVIH